MGHWASKKIATNALKEYQEKNNSYSLDGLPGLRAALRDSGRSVIGAEMEARVRRIGRQREALGSGLVLGIIAVFIFQVAMGMVESI